MSAGTRYCRHCLGLVRSTTSRASATRSYTTGPIRYSSSQSIQRLATRSDLQQQSRYLRDQRESIPKQITPRGVAQFSSSTAQRGAILNPRKDEDGNDMEVDITPRAANRLKAIMDKEANPDLALRVTVESGGCHGFQYLMSLTDMSKVDQQEDTVFEGDKGSRVVMDEPSLELLKGSKVDYTMELIGSQFKIVDNPLATSSCGCGTSFDIKAA